METSPMEQLPSFGTSIAQVVQPTFKAYVPLLLANAEAIKSTRKESRAYGSHPRQQLDVYYPSSDTKHAGPILVYFYGGGLVRGDRTLGMIPQGLVHANIGHFFAEKYGYTVVVPDYRLLSHGAVFPDGGEDVALAVKWIATHLTQPGNKPRNLFLMGNSAGGVHLSTFLFFDGFSETKQMIMDLGRDEAGEVNRLRLKGVVELSVPFHFRNADPSRGNTLTDYYQKDIDDRSPMGLLRGLMSRSSIAKSFPGVKFLVLNGTLDPEDEILIPKRDFVDTWLDGKSEPGEELTIDMMEGQNHISPPLSLATNAQKEEHWGHQVATFIEQAMQ